MLESTFVTVAFLKLLRTLTLEERVCIVAGGLVYKLERRGAAGEDARLCAGACL